MPTKNVDVVIIGGGIVGLSVAHALGGRRAGKILVLERDLLASGGTGRSAATLVPFTPFKAVARLYQDSYDVYARFPELVGGACGFVPVPAAILVADPDLPALREVIGAGKAAGIDLREMPPADFAACEPTAALTNIAGVAYTPQAGYVDPTSTAWSLGGAAQALGVGISTGLPESQAVEIVHDGHKVSGVRTAGDTHYHTRTVVLAAGLDTGRWLQQLGLTDPLREVNQQVGVVKPPPGAARPQHLIVDLPNRMYSRPEANTLTLLSGVHTGMHTPQRGSPPATGDEAAQRYYAGAGARFPALSGAAPVRAWAGVIDQTPDSAPLLGMLPLDGLYVAAGLGAWGVSLAPSIGQLVAGMIVDDYQAIERLIQLRYSRFDEGMALHPQARFAEHSPDSI